MGSVVAYFIFYHIFSPSCSCTLPSIHEESLYVAFEACTHASKVAQATHDHVGLIEFFLKHNDFGEVLINQWALVSQCRDPSKGHLGLVIAYFFLSHFFTYMLLHPFHEVGESLCVAFEACFHASEAALAPYDHVGLIEFYFKTEWFWWGFDQLGSPSGGGSQCRDPSRG